MTTELLTGFGIVAGLIGLAIFLFWLQRKNEKKRLEPQNKKRK
jgi:hypothetical protein